MCIWDCMESGKNKEKGILVYKRRYAMLGVLTMKMNKK